MDGKKRVLKGRGAGDDLVAVDSARDQGLRALSYRQGEELRRELIGRFGPAGIA